MRLDGRFRHAELIGDLLVEQPLRQHHQHPYLLRGQRHQAVAKLGHFRIGRRRHIDIRRNPDIALHHLEDGVAQRIDAEPLRNEAGSAEIQRLPDGADIVAGRHDHHGGGRILRPQIDQPREPGNAGHRQVEQDQIDLRILFQQLGQILERTGFVDPGLRQNAGDGLSQRTAKQRVIVRNDEACGGCDRHQDPCKRFGNPVAATAISTRKRVLRASVVCRLASGKLALLPRRNLAAATRAAAQQSEA